MDQKDPADQESSDLFKSTEARTAAVQSLWLWGITTLLLFFVGMAMMTYGFSTMSQGTKVFCFIFWFLCYVFSARKMRLALMKLSFLRVLPSDQDKGSSK